AVETAKGAAHRRIPLHIRRCGTCAPSGLRGHTSLSPDLVRRPAGHRYTAPCVSRPTVAPSLGVSIFGIRNYGTPAARGSRRPCLRACGSPHGKCRRAVQPAGARTPEARRTRAGVHASASSTEHQPLQPPPEAPSQNGRMRLYAPLVRLDDLGHHRPECPPDRPPRNPMRVSAHRSIRSRSAVSCSFSHSLLSDFTAFRVVAG